MLATRLRVGDTPVSPPASAGVRKARSCGSPVCRREATEWVVSMHSTLIMPADHGQGPASHHTDHGGAAPPLAGAALRPAATSSLPGPSARRCHRRAGMRSIGRRKATTARDRHFPSHPPPDHWSRERGGAIQSPRFPRPKATIFESVIDNSSKSSSPAV